MLLSPLGLKFGFISVKFSPVGFSDSILSNLKSLHPGKGFSPLYAVCEAPSSSHALTTLFPALLTPKQTGSISLSPLPPGSSPS